MCAEWGGAGFGGGGAVGLVVRRWALLALGRVSPVLGLGLWRGVLGGPAGGVPDMP